MILTQNNNTVVVAAVLKERGREGRGEVCVKDDVFALRIPGPIFFAAGQRPEEKASETHNYDALQQTKQA